jgi:hypothetical protein
LVGACINACCKQFTIRDSALDAKPSTHKAFLSSTRERNRSARSTELRIMTSSKDDKRMKRAFLRIACCGCVYVASAAPPAFAQVPCMNEGKAAAKTYQENANLTATVGQVRQLQQAGLDPNHYLVEYNGVYTVLTVKLHDLVEKSAAALESPKSCAENMMPFRKMADVKMIYQHYNLAALLPPNMASTDYYSVAGGAPMPSGGMMPAETIFGVKPLQMSPEMVKILRKPYCIFGACS